MKTGGIALLVLTSLILVAASDADAALTWTTGISGQSYSNTPFATATYGSGTVTSVDTGGRWYRNLSGGSATADVTFTFSGVSFGTSEIMKIYLDSVDTSGVTAEVLTVNGSGVASATAVTLTNTNTLTGYNLPFTLSSGVSSVTSVTIRFTMPNTARVDIDALATPEPTTFALFGLGLVACALFCSRRRRRRRAAAQAV